MRDALTGKGRVQRKHDAWEIEGGGRVRDEAEEQASGK